VLPWAGSLAGRSQVRPLTLRYDGEARAVYIYIGSTEFRAADHTMEISDDVMVDIDSDGRVIGVEVLGVAEPVVHVLHGERPEQTLTARDDLL
jgi:uncharacterized protein YuzE